ncbi:modular serine protease-like [Drosophila obscura]|uniref:modular serine protease-like n=1 Tax=Drosophila obscura TaxID=7282 RepID=UPI001BB21376|nr:modular serine protease-like [Drosophila obscura]
MAEPEPMETVITSTCPDNHSRCPQTDECLEKKFFCDGISDCPNGSDESNESCIASKCPSDTFRCAYGGCLAKAKACDHETDCWDGTDEVPSICFEMRGMPKSELWQSHTSKRNATSRTTPTVLVYPRIRTPSKDSEPTSANGCVIPRSIKHVQVKTLFNVLPYTSGSAIADSVVVRLSCDENRQLNGNDLNHCLNGTWQGPWPECVRTCSDKSFHTDLSIRAVCSYKGKIKSCKSQDTKLFIGTEATVTCAPSYKPRNNAITSEIRSCQRNGTSEIPFWKKQMNKNHQLKCVPECGKILPTVKSDPWLVSIFKSDITLSNYTFQCFGTIISPWMVIVDKYWIDGEDVMHYAIAEGDQKTSFRKNEEHPYALHNVALISKSQIQTRLLLVNPFILSASLRPICLPPLPNVPQKRHPNWIISITTADNQTIFYKCIAEEFLNQKKKTKGNRKGGLN